MWNRVSPQLSSPNQPYSLREALAQAQSSRIGSTARALRESLHPVLRQKLVYSIHIIICGVAGYTFLFNLKRFLQELWEENLSTAVSLEVLRITEKFSAAAGTRSITTDYAKLDCVTSIVMGLLSRSQPLAFWKAFLPVVYNIFNLHGATLMARENDRFLKQIAFHFLRLAVFRNDSIRKRAVVGLQILVRVSCLTEF
jgi:dedicator of cytokinesis protein 6/7/8